MSILPLSYLLLAVLASATLAALGVKRRFRCGLLLVLSAAVLTVAADATASWPPWTVSVPLAAAGLWAALASCGRHVPLVAVTLAAGVMLAGTLTTVEPWAEGLRGTARVALAMHQTWVLALAGLALAAMIRVGARAAGVPQAARWRFLADFAGGLLLLLVLTLAVIFAVQTRPLHLNLEMALMVLPAETLAGLCVWRGLCAVARAAAAPGETSAQGDAAQGDAASQKPSAGATAQGLALRMLFVLTGVSLSLIPAILAAASRLSQ